MFRLTPRIAVLLLANLVPLASTGRAQDVDCQGLRARIDATSRSGTRGGQYSAALRQQQYELRRTQAYSESIGCNSNLLFDNVPADCDAIAARIQRMQDNLAQLQDQAQIGGDESDRRRALFEQYNSYCSGGPLDRPPPDPAQGETLMPIDPDAAPPDEAPPPNGRPADVGARTHRVRALCVRECDGGFFPITDDASSASIEQFDHLCQALCPNTKATLYTAAPSGGIETAVAADGTPYTALPAAFKFQRSFDATCSCKPPHQSWVEALAEAEKLIQSGRGDVTVTQKISDAMSRPAVAGAKSPPKLAPVRKAKAVPQQSAPSLADQGAPEDADTFYPDVTRQLRRDGPML